MSGFCKVTCVQSFKQVAATMSEIVIPDSRNMLGYTLFDEDIHRYDRATHSASLCLARSHDCPFEVRRQELNAPLSRALNDAESDISGIPRFC